MFEAGPNKTIKISKVPGAGLGLYAKRSIGRGEILFEESPLVLIEASVKHQSISWSRKCSYLRKKVKKLTSNERQEYYDLHDCKQTEGRVRL